MIAEEAGPTCPIASFLAKGEPKMPRCNDCNRFVPLEELDPEVNDLEVSVDGLVSASVRIVNACADCGTELREAALDLEADLAVELAGHLGGDVQHKLSVEELAAERTDRTEGKGHGTRTYYGARVEFKVTCSCDPAFGAAGDFDDEVQASAMDEC